MAWSAPPCRSSASSSARRWIFARAPGCWMPPPAGAKSPSLWGTFGRLDQLFGEGATSIKAEPRMFNFRYRSPDHFLEVFKTFYGPALKAFAALDAPTQENLRNDLHALIVRM